MAKTQSLSNFLKAWREHAGISQTDAADLLGVSLRTVQGWEAGKFTPLDKMVRLAVGNFSTSKLRYPK